MDLECNELEKPQISLDGQKAILGKQRLVCVCVGGGEVALGSLNASHPFLLSQPQNERLRLGVIFWPLKPFDRRTHSPS